MAPTEFQSLAVRCMTDCGSRGADINLETGENRRRGMSVALAESERATRPGSGAFAYEDGSPYSAGPATAVGL